METLSLKRGVLSLLGAALLNGCAAPGAVAQISAPKTAMLMQVPHTAQSFPKIEASFLLPDFQGDPYDFEKNDVRISLRLPDGQILSLPAFYDGQHNWRVRHTPTAPGEYAVVGISRSGEKLGATATPQSWSVGGASEPGFVRIDPKNPRRLSFDSGARYYPIGMNQAWRTGGLPDIPVLFGKMGAAGLNWSRVWMNAWDGKNLDWPRHGELGELNLDVARYWDTIVEGAEKSGIYFQLVTQHHGQYTRAVNPNWDDNPYNVKNGGFLATPQEFFTNERARALTKRKLRYSIARYGYSPHILSWELWNEVQFSDAARDRKWDTVAAWHKEMSDFIRAQDPYRHLITTSSEAPPEVYAPLDYYQRHAYPSNLIPVLGRPGFDGPQWPVKPEFTGEFGSDRPEEWMLHSGLWAGLMSATAGAAQYWDWNAVEKENFYPHFAAASGLLKASNFAAHDAQNPLKATRVSITTPQRGALRLGASGDWEAARKSEFDISNPADVAAFAQLPRFLQGQNHRELNPKPITLKFSTLRPGALRLRITQSAKAGANLRIGVNGNITEFPIPAAEQDNNTPREFSVPLNAGAQTVSLENAGQDWVVLRDITIPGAAMMLDGIAKANSNFALAWFYSGENIEAEKPQGSLSGTAIVAGLQPGRYQVTWWDTVAGKPLQVETARADADGLHLQIPSVSRDVAVYARKE